MPLSDFKPAPRASRGAGILIAVAVFLAALGLAIAVWALVAGGAPESETAGTAEPDSAQQAQQDKSRQSGTGTADRPEELAPVPDSVLITKGEYGALPVTGPKGRQPWQVYGRPFDQGGDRPLIAIIVTDIGLNGEMSRAAIRTLPGPVSIAVSPYADDGQSWVNAARSAGHEVFLAVPMDQSAYPADDPGPRALLTSLSAKENLDRLNWFLSRISGYAGVMNAMGSRFTAAQANLRPVIAALADRGLMFLDARTTSNSLAASLAAQAEMPRARVDRTIDDIPSEDAIRKQLNQLAEVAETYGAAVGRARPYPVSLRVLRAWIKTLDKRGFTLAPVTAIANRQPIQ